MHQSNSTLDTLRPLTPFFEELLQQEKPHAALETGSTWSQLFLSAQLSAPDTVNCAAS